MGKGVLQYFATRPKIVKTSTSAGFYHFATYLFAEMTIICLLKTNTAHQNLLFAKRVHIQGFATSHRILRILFLLLR